MGDWIKLKAGDGHELEAWEARPEGPPAGRLVVIQEVFGVNGHIRKVCEGFAADRYVAVAPALYDRARARAAFPYGPEGFAGAKELRTQFSNEDSLRDVEAAVRHLDREGAVAAVGYCWGGTLAWLAATRIIGVAGAVGYYGGQIADHADEVPQCPVLLHFGEADKGIPLDKVETVRAAHPEIPVHTYAGAGHGFNCDERGSYHREAAKLASERTMAFLAQVFGSS